MDKHPKTTSGKVIKMRRIIKMNMFDRAKEIAGREPGKNVFYLDGDAISSSYLDSMRGELDWVVHLSETTMERRNTNLTLTGPHLVADYNYGGNGAFTIRQVSALEQYLRRQNGRLDDLWISHPQPGRYDPHIFVIDGKISENIRSSDSITIVPNLNEAEKLMQEKYNCEQPSIGDVTFILQEAGLAGLASVLLSGRKREWELSVGALYSQIEMPESALTVPRVRAAVDYVVT